MGSLSQQQIDAAVSTLHEGNERSTPKGQSGAATAQRYPAGFVQEGRATMRLRYGSTGRPEHEYRWRS